MKNLKINVYFKTSLEKIDVVLHSNTEHICFTHKQYGPVPMAILSQHLPSLFTRLYNS